MKNKRTIFSDVQLQVSVSVYVKRREEIRIVSALLVLSYELAVSMIANSNRKAKKCGLQIAAMMESDK